MLTTKIVNHIGNCLRYSVRDTAYVTLIGGFAFSLYATDQGPAIAHRLFQEGSSNSDINLLAVYGWLAGVLAMNAVTVFVMDVIVRLLLSPTKWLAVSGWTLFRKMTSRNAKATEFPVEVHHVG